MNDSPDKFLGSWCGMAIGDAMGSAAQSLKPASIVQFYKSLDDYKDVRPFIGKGVRQYRMKGLYGAQTQTALAACHALLRSGKMERDALLTELIHLAQGGSELYFGVFRRAEASLRRALASVDDDDASQRFAPAVSSGNFLTLGVPVALFHGSRADRVLRDALSACEILCGNFLEMQATAVTALLVGKFAKTPAPEPEGAPAPDWAQGFWQDARRFAEEAEQAIAEQYPATASAAPRAITRALAETFDLLAKEAAGKSTADLLALVADNAGNRLTRPISHAAQGYVLTLLPTALVMTLAHSREFSSALSAALHLGGDAEKLGALTGALAGALHGVEGIPDPLKTGLVNGREIRLRGEALLRKKTPSGMKGLFEMESGLTAKEAEERKKYLDREPKKIPRSGPAEPEEEIEESLRPSRENPWERRQFERDKSRKKRDRRRNMDWDD